MSVNKIYTINSLKFDGKIDKSWQAKLINDSQDLIVFEGVFEKEIKHSNLGVIRRGTLSYEFYWKSRWYNIFRFHEPDGTLRNFYCNINRPPEIVGNVLNYTDLDLDVLVQKDLSYEVIDADEFEINAESFGYTKEIRQKVDESLAEIIKLIENKDFPFDFKVE